jgi:hypothetical protein
MPFLNKMRHRQNTGPLGTMYSFVCHRSSSDEDQLKPGPLTAGDHRRGMKLVMTSLIRTLQADSDPHHSARPVTRTMQLARRPVAILAAACRVGSIALIVVCVGWSKEVRSTCCVQMREITERAIIGLIDLPSLLSYANNSQKTWIPTASLWGFTEHAEPYSRSG